MSIFPAKKHGISMKTNFDFPFIEQSCFDVLCRLKIQNFCLNIKFYLLPRKFFCTISKLKNMFIFYQMIFCLDFRSEHFCIIRSHIYCKGRKINVTAWSSKMKGKNRKSSLLQFEMHQKVFLFFFFCKYWLVSS